MTRHDNYLLSPLSAFPVNLVPKFISELWTSVDGYFNEVFKNARVVDKLALTIRVERDTEFR